MPETLPFSSRKTLYTELKAFIADKLPEVRHIALYNRQFDNEPIETPFNFPVIFIEFGEGNYTQLAQGYKKFEMVVRIYIGWETYAFEDLDALDFLEKVSRTVDGFDATGFVPMFKVSEKPDHDHDNRVITVMEFMTAGVEAPAESGTTETDGPVTLIVTADLKIDNTVIRTGNLSS